MSKRNKAKQAAYMRSYRNDNVITSFSLNKKTDKVIIDWLNKQSNRGNAIRCVLREVAENE